MSEDMPHTPSGGGSIAPPISAWPSVRILMKELRSSANPRARRIFGLSKGNPSRLTIRLMLTLVGSISQIARGAWLAMSRRSGMVNSYGKVRSNFPAIKASTAVERSGHQARRSGSPQRWASWRRAGCWCRSMIWQNAERLEAALKSSGARLIYATGASPRGERRDPARPRWRCFVLFVVSGAC